MYPKAYFDGKLAIGAKVMLDRLPDFSKDPAGIYFGGIDFFGRPRKTALWDGFGPKSFFLPETIIEKKLMRPKPLPRLLKRIDAPDRKRYGHLLDGILKTLGDRVLNKVVMARCTTLHFADALCPFNVLTRFKKRGEPFLLQFEPGKAFVGSTPEMLYKRDKSSIETVAIAGTRPRGKKQREELLTSEKDIREFEFVKRDIGAKLGTLCESVKVDASQQTLEAGNVQHLFSRFEGALKKSVTDKEIIETLHPTPAMGGLPKGSAMDVIYKSEPFDRGYYASPIGTIAPEHAHLLVGIRSALVDENRLHLFAGGGIVDGSTAENEWEELNHKIAMELL